MSHFRWFAVVLSLIVFVLGCRGGGMLVETTPESLTGIQFEAPVDSAWADPGLTLDVSDHVVWIQTSEDPLSARLGVRLADDSVISLRIRSDYDVEPVPLFIVYKGETALFYYHNEDFDDSEQGTFRLAPADSSSLR